MILERMYNRTATTSREGFVAGSDIKKDYTPYLSSFQCHVQALDSTLGQDLPGAFGKQWLMVCPVLDIVEGDKIHLSDGLVYRVMAIETYDISRNPHCELTIKTFKS